MTLMQMLKEQTAPAHARIEAEFRLTERLASRGPYLALLHSLHAFHDAWERNAARHLDAHLLEPRRKAHLLRDDIAALGGDARAMRPVAPEFSFVTDTATALGAMYVVEGSMLGGAIIAAQVERRLGLTRANGCSFFRAYGADLAARWREFGAHVNALSAPGTDVVVVAAAEAMFNQMRATLTLGTWHESNVAA